MYGKIYCMLNSSTPLTKGMGMELFRVARKMLLERKSREGFLSEEMGGVVTTTFRENSVGQISGVVFSAEVESNGGRGQVVYLVNPTDVVEDTDGFQWVSLKDYLRQAQEAASMN